MRSTPLGVILALTVVLAATAHSDVAKPLPQAGATKAKDEPAAGKKASPVLPTVISRPAPAPGAGKAKPVPAPGTSKTKPVAAPGSGKAAPAQATDGSRTPSPSAPLPGTVPSLGAPSRVALVDPIAGTYASDGRADDMIMIERVGKGLYRVFKPGEWEGVGIFDGSLYWGVFRYDDRSRVASLAGALGAHRAVREKDGSFRVHGEFMENRGEAFDHRWQMVSSTGNAGRPLAPDPLTERRPDDRPAFGAYTYVEELPEAVTKVPPGYPEEARRAGVDGTVMLQALVDRYGHVVDTRVVKSIPMLDAAAVACARQWIFKPALSGGKPIAVWVAVPVRFTLH